MARSPGIAGRFSYFGDYPPNNGSSHPAEGNATITELPDGRLLFYGVNIDSWGLGRSFDLRKRHQTSGLIPPPKLWDPARHHWIKLERPPECPQNAVLATATALPDGKVLIAGGICDLPVLYPPPAEKAQHTALSLWDSDTGKWLPTPSMPTSRIFHTATLLNNGSVLIIGGETDPDGQPEGIEPVMDSVLNYKDGRIDQIAPLARARARHTATELADGRVLVVGGFDKTGHAIASAEVWNGMAWREIAPLHTARYAHTATRLDDGRVMIAGGKDAQGNPLSSVEILDPGSESWSPGRPLLRPLFEHTSVRLQNGDVFIAGGISQSPNMLSAEEGLAMLWDKANDEWQPAGAYFQTRKENNRNINLLPMPDGSVRVFGLHTIEYWRPAHSAQASRPVYGRRRYYAAVALADDRILLAGGLHGSAFLDQAEIYDPETGHFTPTGRMQLARHSHAMLRLDDGSVVAAGGWARSPNDMSQPLGSSPERWDPASGRWQTIENIRFEWQDRVSMAKLDDGTVLFFASRELYEGKLKGPVKYRAWIWNPATQQVKRKKVPVPPRSNAAIAIRPDATVLFVGGKLRSLVPKYRCQNRPPQQHRSTIEKKQCRDKAAYWREDIVHSAYLWDSRRGRVIPQASPGAFVFRQPQTLVLRNGDVVLADRVQPDFYGSVDQSPVVLWQAKARKWIELPGIPAQDMFDLRETADGTLWTRNAKLTPGASDWLEAQGIQGSDAHRLITLSGAQISIDMDPPYVARYLPSEMRWKIVRPPSQEPAWRLPPALVPLHDSRLMAIGLVENGPAAAQTAYIWDPVQNIWYEAGRLATHNLEGQAIALSSGAVLHVGNSPNSKTAACELWHPTDNAWTACGTLEHLQGENRIKMSLQHLADGQAAVMTNKGEVWVFREQKRAWERLDLEINNEKLPAGMPVRPQKGYYAQVFDRTADKWIDASELVFRSKKPESVSINANSLWDENNRQWAFIVPQRDGSGLGEDAVFLPDGCALSSSPLRLFDPHTNEFRTLTNPDGIGVKTQRTQSMAVFADGTVVIAGPGREFFHRKASCAGFDLRSDEEQIMTPVWAVARITEPAPSPPIVQTLSVDSIPFHTRAMEQLREYQWILLAIFAPLVGYFILSRLQRAVANSTEGHKTNEYLERVGLQWSPGFRWTLRLIVYGTAAALILPWLQSLLWVRQQTNAEDCKIPSAKCMDARGIIPPIAELRTGQADGSESTRIPCHYVGVWSSNRGNIAYRITLYGDGRYEIAPNAYLGSKKYTGYWAVQGKNMIWRHNQNNPGFPDVNLISTESDERFTLTEMNGSRTRFDLIEHTKSTRCVP